MANVVPADAGGIHRLLCPRPNSSARLHRRRDLEDYAAIFVLLLSGIEIEIGKGDLARVAGRQIEKRCADDGIVSDLEFMAVFENQNG